MTGKISCLRASAGLLALAMAACDRGPGPVDLLTAADRLQEATAAGQGREAVLGAVGQGLRVNDVLRRGFPAGPPGRLRFALDIPKGAHLTFGCAIDPRFHDRPGVEFFVKVGPEKGREEIVWTRLLDPIAHVQDRRWVTAAVASSYSRPAATRRRAIPGEPGGELRPW
jgi:hypothetical protein